jgi:serine/threonine protein kinase
MPLAAGTRLGPFEIAAPLGAGGMGEVYRARDTRLNRDVAIKILPEVFALDADRLARFKRRSAASSTRSSDVSTDGRFLMIERAMAPGGAEGTGMVVVLNWAEELKRLLPREP